MKGKCSYCGCEKNDLKPFYYVCSDPPARITKPTCSTCIIKLYKGWVEGHSFWLSSNKKIGVDPLESLEALLGPYLLKDAKKSLKEQADSNPPDKSSSC